jgi:hypothetical protein
LHLKIGQISLEVDECGEWMQDEVVARVCMDAGVFTDPSNTWWLECPCYVPMVGVEVGDSMDAGVFTGVS